MRDEDEGGSWAVQSVKENFVNECRDRMPYSMTLQKAVMELTEGPHPAEDIL